MQRRWATITAAAVVCTVAVYATAQDFLRCAGAYASVDALPLPTQALDRSVRFEPALLQGVRVDPQDPLKLDFYFTAPTKGAVTRSDAQRLIRYFLTGITVPQGDVWVNLSPYEADRVIDDALAPTELGHDLMAQDYLLKQLTAGLSSPNNAIGKRYWKQVFSEQAASGDAARQIDSYTKVWIVPERAAVHSEGTSAAITEMKLDVMLDCDHQAMREGKAAPVGGAAEAMRAQVLGALRDEVSHGKQFSTLRQMYSALILAVWFKKHFASTAYRRYIDASKMRGVDVSDPAFKAAVFERYRDSFEKGVYDKTRAGKDPLTGKTVQRRYFLGGIQNVADVAEDPALPTAQPQAAFSVRLDAQADVSASPVLARMTGVLDAMRRTVSPLLVTAFLLLPLAAHGFNSDSSSVAAQKDMAALIRDKAARLNVLYTRELGKTLTDAAAYDTSMTRIKTAVATGDSAKLADALRKSALSLRSSPEYSKAAKSVVNHFFRGDFAAWSEAHFPMAQALEKQRTAAACTFIVNMGATEFITGAGITSMSAFLTKGHEDIAILDTALNRIVVASQAFGDRSVTIIPLEKTIKIGERYFLDLNKLGLTHAEVVAEDQAVKEIESTNPQKADERRRAWSEAMWQAQMFPFVEFTQNSTGEVSQNLAGAIYHNLALWAMAAHDRPMAIQFLLERRAAFPRDPISDLMLAQVYLEDYSVSGNSAALAAAKKYGLSAERKAAVVLNGQKDIPVYFEDYGTLQADVKAVLGNVASIENHVASLDPVYRDLDLVATGKMTLSTAHAVSFMEALRGSTAAVNMAAADTIVKKVHALQKDGKFTGDLQAFDRAAATTYQYVAREFVLGADFQQAGAALGSAKALDSDDAWYSFSVAQFWLDQSRTTAIVFSEKERNEMRSKALAALNRINGKPAKRGADDKTLQENIKVMRAQLAAEGVQSSPVKQLDGGIDFMDLSLDETGSSGVQIVDFGLDRQIFDGFSFTVLSRSSAQQMRPLFSAQRSK